LSDVEVLEGQLRHVEERAGRLRVDLTKQMAELRLAREEVTLVRGLYADASCRSENTQECIKEIEEDFDD